MIIGNQYMGFLLKLVTLNEIYMYKKKERKKVNDISRTRLPAFVDAA